jgi:hypothetical protein
MITDEQLLGKAAKQNIAPGLEIRHGTMAWRFSGLLPGGLIGL